MRSLQLVQLLSLTRSLLLVPRLSLRRSLPLVQLPSLTRSLPLVPRLSLKRSLLLGRRKKLPKPKNGLVNSELTATHCVRPLEA